MKKIIVATLLCLSIALSAFVCSAIWTLEHLEVYWNHDSVSLYLCGHEWVYDAYCDCTDCELARNM